MKVGVLGRTAILYDTILRVKKSSHKIAFIVTSSEAPEYSVTSKDFKNIAAKLKVPFLCTEKINSKKSISFIKKHSSDIGVSVNWKTIIGNEAIKSFKFGIVNAHAGDLPRYRGNATPNWAILSGEDRIVLTLHLMTAGLDSGPVLLKKNIPISRNTYIGEVYELICKNIPAMFIEVLDGLSDGTVKQRLQIKDPSLALRCYPRLPRDSEINWNQSAIQIDRLVKASSEPFAGAYTFLGSEKLIIWRSHIENSRNPILGIPGQIAEIRTRTNEVAVITKDGIIVLEEVENKSKGRKKAGDIIKSIRIRLGMDICNEILLLKKDIRRLESILKDLII